MELLLATSNKHKLQEIREILSPYGITVYGISDLDLHPGDIEENGTTFEENAIIKGAALAKLTSIPVIADDSGLEIRAMDNAPGIYSARFASSFGGHEKAIEYILNELKDKDDRYAQFVCTIALFNVEKEPIVFKGICKGEIATSIKGSGGFGYDPVFKPDGYQDTFAYLGEEVKNKISHRSLAITQLINYLKERGLIK